MADTTSMIWESASVSISKKDHLIDARREIGLKDQWEQQLVVDQLNSFGVVKYSILYIILTATQFLFIGLIYYF